MHGQKKKTSSRKVYRMTQKSLDISKFVIGKLFMYYKHVK